MTKISKGLSVQRRRFILFLRPSIKNVITETVRFILSNIVTVMLHCVCIMYGLIILFIKPSFCNFILWVGFLMSLY